MFLDVQAPQQPGQVETTSTASSRVPIQPGTFGRCWLPGALWTAEGSITVYVNMPDGDNHQTEAAIPAILRGSMQVLVRPETYDVEQRNVIEQSPVRSVTLTRQIQTVTGIDLTLGATIPSISG